MERNLTTGSVTKTIFSFSLPYLLSYFLQLLYGMADLFIIGQYEGIAATTAVSVGSQIMHVLTVMIVGLAMGALVNIGQAIGRNDLRGAAAFIGSTVTLFLMLSLVLTGVLLALVSPIVSLMSTPDAAVAGARQYLVICFLGIPFITAYNILSSIFRGMGDSKSPMCFVAVACAANIALDELFIGVLHLGAAGAALGTTIAQAISVAVSLLVIVRRKSGIRLQKRDLVPRRSRIVPLLRVGIPITLQEGFIQLSFITITVIANQRGLVDAAAVGIVEKMMSFFFIIPSTMLSTVSALGAQCIGADKPERAIQTMRCAIRIACAIDFFVAVLTQLAAQPLVGLFTPDAATVSAGSAYLRSYVLDCFFGGIHFCFSGYFCARKKSALSFLHNVISSFCIRIPGAYLASRCFPHTLFPMGLASVFGSLVSCMLCLIFFLAIRKRDRRTLDAQALR